MILPEKLSCNFCCGRVSQKSRLKRNRLKVREQEEGGGKQEIIHLHNTALKNWWDAFCQGWVTGPRVMSYSGLTSHQLSFTQVGLLDIISVSVQSRKLQALGFCTSHDQTAAAVRTWATTPEDTQLFKPLLMPQSWQKGSSQLEMFWEPLVYK